jgi:hypothetical protein
LVSFGIKVKGDLFMEESVKKNNMDLYTQRDTRISVKCIELELARVIRHDTLTMYTPSDICCEFELVDLLYRNKWN